MLDKRSFFLSLCLPVCRGSTLGQVGERSPPPGVFLSLYLPVCCGTVDCLKTGSCSVGTKMDKVIESETEFSFSVAKGFATLWPNENDPDQLSSHLSDLPDY